MTIQQNISLKPYNTFGIDAVADLFAVFSSLQELIEIYQSEHWKNRRLILGGGSNILLSQDFKGIVIKNEILGVDKIDEDEDYVFLQIGAGENWHEVVQQCVSKEWGGLENLSLIPGTVGAAPIQNIGAYGVELRNIFEGLTAYSLREGKALPFSKKDCRFGYRNSIFKKEWRDQYIITDITLRLTRRNHVLHTDYGDLKDHFQNQSPTIKAISDAVIRIRQEKLPDPAKIGNAGSFFKNPEVDGVDFQGLRAEFPSIPGYKLDRGIVKIPAAWLIDQCGWKGHRRNGFGVHDKQALVLVNYGNSKGADIVELAMEIKDSVADKFGIILAEEVRII